MSFETEFPKRTGETESEGWDSLSPAERFARAIHAGRGWPFEERLHRSADAWQEEMGPAYVPRSKRLVKRLAAGLRMIVEEMGEEQAPDFIRWATGEMKQRRLTVADIYSIHWLFGAYREQGEEHDEWNRRRYLRGSLANDDD